MSAIPYVKWSPRLVTVFLTEVGDLGAEQLKTALSNYHTAEKGKRREAKQLLEAAQRREKATDKLVKYLRKIYLSPTHQNGYKFWGYSTEDSDLTNNSNESGNHLLNSVVSKNLKTYRAAVSTLHDYLSEWIQTPTESVI